MSFQRLGGVAAMLAAGTYIVGFWFYFSLIEPARYGSSQIDPAQHVLFLVENQALMRSWNLVIYVANSLFMVVLAIALHRRIQSRTTELAQMATAFGLIWAGLVLASGMIANISLNSVTQLYQDDPVLAGTIWRALVTVQEGLGGGNEIAGSLWILLASGGAQWSKSLPTALNALGAAIGLAGLLTVIPAMSEAASVFGLGFIVWFLWIGVVLTFGRPHPAVPA